MRSRVLNTCDHFILQCVFLYLFSNFLGDRSFSVMVPGLWNEYSTVPEMLQISTSKCFIKYILIFTTAYMC